jgi:hypothetical protein
VATLKQEFHDAFLASPQGVQAMEEMVRTVHMNEVTVEARRNVVRMAETGLLNNRGEMIGIERDARTNLLARFLAESNDQEDEWRRAYFERLMERLKNGHTDARLAPPETASQFVWDVAGAINAEVESRVDRMVRTIESTAREAYAEETKRIVAKAEAKARQDAKAQADEAFQVIYDCDMKVNHSLSDISLENICREFRVQLEHAKEHVREECAADTKMELDAFRARVLLSSAATLPPSDNLVAEVTSWAEAHGFNLITEVTRDESDGRGGKHQDLGGGKKRTRGGVVRSRSLSISSWGPLPSAPTTPTTTRKKLDELSFDNLKTPTSVRPLPPSLSFSLKMDIDKSDVQSLQGHMEELFERKKEAKQTVSASLHNPANQMAVSPPTVEAPMAAESIMSPRPRKSATPIPPPPPPSTSDPTLLAILATLEHLSGEVKGLGSRLAAVEEGPVQEPRRCMKPSAAPPISMPPKPSNLTLDLKAMSGKAKTTPLPKLPPTAAPNPSSSRADNTDAFTSYQNDSYDDDFPDNLPAAPKPVPGKAAEWVEIKSRPNHKRGIINLDYATVAQTNVVQNQAVQVKHSLNRTNTGGPMRTPGQSNGPNTTIITIVRSGGLEDQAEENNIRQLSEQFLIMSARLAIEKITTASISVVGGWWVVKADKKGNRRCNGNFNFTVAGHVPHEQILPFQHVFLEHLKVGAVVTAGNWVWANLRNVPTTDPMGNIAGPEVLLKEMRQNPILADLSFPQMPHYTCNPNNLRDTATVAFAYLDVTGKVARSAGAKGVWMFGVCVQFVRTGDSPVFTQCGKCHELGHVTAGCTMTRNSSKCYRCGGSHESGAHDEKCKATTHRIGGVCDCAFPCLLCKQTGHHCRSKDCPKRGPFRPPPLASTKNPNPSPSAALAAKAPAASAQSAPKPKAKKTTMPIAVDKVLTQCKPLRDSPTPPPRSKPSATIKRLTMGNIPIRVKPTRQQIAANKAEQQTAKYLLGIKNKKTATMSTGASNRFKALEETAHIEEVEQPESKDKSLEVLPAVERLASVESDLYADPTAVFTAASTDSAVPVADFLCRESFAWFDAARLPPFAIVHLKLTKGLDAEESTNVMKSVGKDWAICTTEIDSDLKNRICYAYLQGWPLTKQDTRARIQEGNNLLGGFTDDSSAMRYGCMTLDEVTPHDYYRYHTKQTEQGTGVLFLTYPELSTAASLAEYLQRGGVERSARVAVLRALDIGLGGNSNGHTLEQHWPESEYSILPTLKNTFINWFLAGQEAQEDLRCDTIIHNLTETIRHESIQLVNIGGKGPAISYEGAHCVTSQRLVLLDLSVFGSLAFDRSPSRNAGDRPAVLNRLPCDGRCSFVLR